MYFKIVCYVKGLIEGSTATSIFVFLFFCLQFYTELLNKKCGQQTLI